MKSAIITTCLLVITVYSDDRERSNVENVIDGEESDHDARPSKLRQAYETFFEVADKISGVQTNYDAFQYLKGLLTSGSEVAGHAVTEVATSATTVAVNSGYTTIFGTVLKGADVVLNAYQIYQLRAIQKANSRMEEDLKTLKETNQKVNNHGNQMKESIDQLSHQLTLTKNILSSKLNLYNKKVTKGLYVLDEKVTDLKNYLIESTESSRMVKAIEIDMNAKCDREGCELPDLFRRAIARYTYGEMLYSGVGLTTNIRSSLEYMLASTDDLNALEKSGEFFNPQSYFMVGFLIEKYPNEKFFNANINRVEKMKAYYQKAADQGHSGAAYRLALCFKRELENSYEIQNLSPRSNLLPDFSTTKKFTTRAAKLQAMLKLFQDAAIQQHLHAQIELFQSFNYESYKFDGMLLEHPTQWIVFILKNPNTVVRSVLRSLLVKLISDRKISDSFFQLVVDQISNNFMYFDISTTEEIFGVFQEILEFYSDENKHKFDALNLLIARKAQAQVQFNDGVSHIQKKEYKVGLNLLKLSASGGNHEAQFNLAVMYYFGLGTVKNYYQAQYYFELSINKGYKKSASYSCLGRIHEFGGYEVEKNLKKSLDFYKLAVANGLQLQTSVERVKGKIDMEYQTGLRHFNKKEYEDAFIHTKLSADGGHVFARNLLGLMYEDGYGVTKDLSKAFELYERGVKQNNAEAQFSLGFMYERGDGVAKDLSKAKKYYELAAAQGFTTAQLALSHLKK